MFGQLVGAWEAEPGTIDTCEAAKGILVAEHTPFDHIVCIAEAPWDEAKACNAEKGVEDLRVIFDPLLACGGEVIA